VSHALLADLFMHYARSPKGHWQSTRKGRKN